MFIGPDDTKKKSYLCKCFCFQLNLLFKQLEETVSRYASAVKASITFYQTFAKRLVEHHPSFLFFLLAVDPSIFDADIQRN